MKDYVWFQLIVRAIGILILALSVPEAIWTVMWSIGQIMTGASGFLSPGEHFVAVAVSLIGAFVRVAVGAYLLFGGRALVAYCIARVGDRCVRCGYDVSGTPAGPCPECGTPFTEAPGETERAPAPTAPRPDDAKEDQPT